MKINSHLSIHNVIAEWATKSPDRLSILAPGRNPLTYSKLYDQTRYCVRTLNSMGIKRNNRVAVVMPNGPEMASAFLSIASGMTCAPLNPGYRFPEFEFFLSDLNAKGVIIDSRLDSPAQEVAEKLGIKVIKLIAGGQAGEFSLESEEEEDVSKCTFADPQDVALILHTSGTTSRPKIVPLTHVNLCTSAYNIYSTLRLSNKDRCLNIMPLFHIHGLIGVTLSSMVAGASLVCTPGFLATKFYELLDEFDPTWYSAVPTMHQAILARAELNSDIVKKNKLRFIRSSSSALPPQVMLGLEDVFGVPVIESYGMTEASHQMASNPLPPLQRKPGSVGIPAGPEIAIMDIHSEILQQGGIGEIVIRGNNVTLGYENNPEANEVAFTGGWFRTGDEGYFDEEGFLVITDRIKEIINRGGEKVSPREIDEVLLDHPDILQVVTFAMPHNRLGEEVAAAVVLKEDSVTSEWDIQEFASQRLADFKVPRRVVLLDDIPKGPTGKMQRVGLAEKLGLVTDEDEIQRSVSFEHPSTDMEKMLVEIWENVLDVKPIGILDNYFQLGGDSILAGLIITEICKALKIKELPLVLFLHAPTIKTMATILTEKNFILPSSSLVAIQSKGDKTPIYIVHSCDGGAFLFSNLTGHLEKDRPAYAFRAQGLDGIQSPYQNVEDMANQYLKEMIAFQMNGPYILGGVGVGGLVALEMAQKLSTDSEQVETLFLIDTVFPEKKSLEKKGLIASVEYMIKRFFFYLKRGEIIGELSVLLDDFYRKLSSSFSVQNKVWVNITRAGERYEPKSYSGNVVQIIPENRLGFSDDPLERVQKWSDIFENSSYSVINGNHQNIFQEPYVQELAEKIIMSLCNENEDH